MASSLQMALSTLSAPAEPVRPSVWALVLRGAACHRLGMANVERKLKLLKRLVTTDTQQTQQIRNK